MIARSSSRRVGSKRERIKFEHDWSQVSRGHIGIATSRELDPSIESGISKVQRVKENSDVRRRDEGGGDGVWHCSISQSVEEENSSH